MLIVFLELFSPVTHNKHLMNEILPFFLFLHLSYTENNKKRTRQGKPLLIFSLVWHFMQGNGVGSRGRVTKEENALKGKE